MKVKDLIAELQKLVAENPEYADYAIAQQDAYSEPRALADCQNVYVGEFYETESSGYLTLEDAEEDGEDIERVFPVVVIEAF